MTNSTTFQPPVDKLLSFGDCYETMNRWPNYITELGLDSQHVPDLIKVAVDKELHEAEEKNPQTSAGVHAWRALGQLHAEAAIEPLMSLFHEVEDNDWVSEELPKVYGMIGCAAIEPLASYLSDSQHSDFPRVAAINSLGEIAQKHSDCQQHCIAALTQQLKLFTHNSEELNGFIVSSLINLKASESAGVIKSAFAAKTVCEDIVGTWDNVREHLGVSDDEIEEFQPEEITITPEESTDEVEFEEIDEPIASQTTTQARTQTTASVKEEIKAELISEEPKIAVEAEQQHEPIAEEITASVEEEIEAELISEEAKIEVEAEQQPEPIAEEITASVEEEIEAELISEEPTTPEQVQAEQVIEELIPEEQVAVVEAEEEVIEEVVEEIKPEIKGFGRSSGANEKSKEKAKVSKKKKSSSRGFNQL
jgi:Protein of unknown function (DUF1186)